MRGVVLVAIVAAIGNALQGWDNSNIAGAVMYIKEEFDLQNDPTVEGLIVAMSLIGGTTITMFSGPMSDWLGRRPMLIMSAIFFFLGGLVMMWSPNVYVLLFARLLDGFGTGLAVTLVPVYISETAPSDIRGQLNTLPQFTGSTGMFLSYCMVFGMSLMNSPNWRFMLGFIAIPSLFFFLLTLFYLPESPRWLVSKGRMLEAKQVLQRLRGCQDVMGELGLLLEGLGTSGKTSLEEYIVGPTNNGNGVLIDSQLKNASADSYYQKDQVRLYGPEEGFTWIAKPVNIGQSALCSNNGSPANRSIPRKDPLVSLFGSIHEKHSEPGSMKSLLSPYLGSILNISEDRVHSSKGQWDFECQKNGQDQLFAGDAAESVDSDDHDNLRSPLLSCRMSSVDKDIYPPSASGSIIQVNAAAGETAISSSAIGGGWQLAWKWSEKDGEKEGVFKRLYLHNFPPSQRGSIVSVSGGETIEERDMVHAAALVSQSAISSKDFLPQQSLGGGKEEEQLIHPKENFVTRPNKWKGLLEPGVKRALVVGIGLQILQQASGINGVLYFAPQILEQAGVPLLLSNMGISSASASLLISTLTTLLMLPCIGVSIWLMDIAGRRCLLLSTIPVLIMSLTFLVLGSIIEMGSILKATILTGSLVVYLCCFVMSFGVIPNILCAEIFPTHVRGLCIALCSLTYWIGNMVVTYSFPVMLKSMGLGGVFGTYVFGCIVSWIFVFLKVPETKGMPLEVISDFFSVNVREVAC